MEEFRVAPGGDVHRRLDRIEHRLDQITALLERLARVEERQHQWDSNYHDDMLRVNSRVDEIYRRTEQLELLHANTAIIMKWAQMVFWLVIAGAVTLIGKAIFGGSLGGMASNW